MNSVDSTYGLGEADCVGTNEDPIVAGLSRAQRNAYVKVLDWQRRNPGLPLECAFSRLGVDPGTYYRARRKAEASQQQAFECHSADLIRPGLGILKSAPRAGG